MVHESDIEVLPIAAFSDNYFWLIRRGNHAAVVDPGAARPVLDTLNRLGIDLNAILITHHHADHIGGIRELLQCYPQVTVYGPAKEHIPGVTVPLSQGNTMTVDRLDLHFEVIDVPGHTLGHIAYYVRNHSPPWLFCGDTLFSVGCGRLFEGTPGDLHRSLAKLAVLPPSTSFFCAHEYTLKNIAFARQVEPANAALLERAQQTSVLREKGRPTLPATIGMELATNPFLRTGFPEVKAAAENYAGKTLTEPVDVFAALRRWKDEY